MKNTLTAFFILSVSIILSGCFSGKEAPEREITARGLDEAVSMAATVQRVDLSGSMLTSVPQELASMPELRTLYLADGAFTNLSALTELKGVEVLDLSRVKFSKMPAEVAKLLSLRDLYLGGTGLTEFPSELSALPALRYLNLDRNNIAALPDELPVNLRWLRLNGNKLTSLPVAIGSLSKLERVYLKDNQLTSLPAEITKCTLLEDIDLSGNNLNAFPEVLLDLPKLRNLNLTGNKGITTLPDTWELSNMTALRTLQLTGLPLSEGDKERLRTALPKCFIIF